MADLAVERLPGKNVDNGRELTGLIMIPFIPNHIEVGDSGPARKQRYICRRVKLKRHDYMSPANHGLDVSGCEARSLLDAALLDGQSGDRIVDE